MKSFAKHNEGITFLLTIIDIYSKFAWIIPLRDKTGLSITKAFQELFKEGKKPTKLWVDQGKEFLNKEFKPFLLKHNVEMYQTFNEGKAVVIERFNRTIKEKMWRYFTEFNTKKYLDVLPKLLKEYNNSYHSTIKMTPTEGSNPKKKIIYTYDLSNDKPKLRIGDRVRIYKYKKDFDKGYETNWTTEIFVISDILKTNPITYKIKDLNDEQITGSFYLNELNKSLL